jgi:hypothetical protein
MSEDEKAATEEVSTPTPPPSGPVRKPTPLQRDSDYAQRPGFRNPANVGSKAMKKADPKAKKKR